MAIYKTQISMPLVVLALLVSGCGNGNGNSAQGGQLQNPPPPNSAVYEMVWSDEFDGSSLNLDNWDVQTGNGAEEGIPGWGNNELQYYTADNILLVDGNLVIEARAGDSPNPDFRYTSARIRTQGKTNGDITYGRIEASIKVPPGVGLWSAFWMLGTDPSDYGLWAGKGEIDILESFGGDDPFAQAALHFGMQGPLNQLVFKKNEEVDPTDDFHQYAVEWDINQIRWYIDGKHYYTVRKESYWNYFYKDMMTGFLEGGPSAPFDKDQHIILNMAVGGNLPGAPTDPSVFPAQMLVDYVRIYECPIDPKNTGLGCANSIDEVNPFIVGDVPDADVFSTSYQLYLNGLETLFEGTGSDRVLGFATAGAMMITELDGTDGNKVIDAMTTGGGSFSVKDVSGAPFNLFGMGSGEQGSGTYGGEIKFDIQVIGGTDTDLSGGLRVKMDSGLPDVGYVEIPLSQLPVNQFTSISLRISDILQSNQGAEGGGVPDIAGILNLVTFETTGPAHLQVSNIRLACGGPSTCGIESRATVPFEVFTDDVNERWGRGIVAYDTVAGGDYNDNASGNHVTWELVDTAEEGHDTVIEATFSDSNASGVIFIGAPAGETIDISGYAKGELAFDVRVTRNPKDLSLFYKVDGVAGAGTGEKSLGKPELNVWKSYAIPVSTLRAQGLTLSEVTAVVLLPTFTSGQDVVLEWDNVRFEPDSSGTAVQVGLPVDFESENAFYNLNNFNGGASILFDNPDQSGINTSATVVRMQKFGDQVFGGTTLVIDIPADFSRTEVMLLKVWSQRPVDVTLKLEEAGTELVARHGGSGWEELRYNFTGLTVPGEVAFTIIFDNGTLGNAEGDAQNWTFYYDDLAIDEDSAGPPTGGDGATGCLQCTDFESGNTVFLDIGSPTMTMLMADPLDASNTVARTVKPLGAPSTAGATVNPGTIVYPLDSTRNVITVRVYSPDADVPVRLRLEDMANPARYVEAEALTTQIDTWETLVFDFGNPVNGSPAINPGFTYNMLSIFFNFGTDGDTAGEKTYLWDTIEFVNGDRPPSYSQNFETLDAGLPTALGTIGGDGYQVFGAVFDNSNTVFQYQYGPFTAPNGGAGFSAIASGEGGGPQGAQYLNVYSDYNNTGAHQGLQQVRASVFQEFTVRSGDSGIYRLSFDAKAPVVNGIAPPTKAVAYIQTLDPNAGFIVTRQIELNMSGVRNDQWVRYSFELEIDAAQQTGQLLQFGWTTTATNFNNSGIYYDNIDFGLVTE